MTRDTSIEAYNTIKENGLLSQRRWEVYDILFRKGPLTANEAFRAIALESGKKASSLLSVSNARFTELRNVGVVREVRDRKCSVTGVNVIEWDVTSRKPSAPTAKKESKEAKIIRLEKRVAELEEELQMARPKYKYDNNGQGRIL